MALPAWPYIFTPTLSLWLIGVWAVSQTSHAHAMCDSVGFPQPHDQPLNTFFYLFANKEGVLGLIFVALQLAGEWKAAGIMLMGMCVGGAGDLYLAVRIGSMGWLEAFQAHGLVTCIGAWAGVRLMRENW